MSILISVALAVTHILLEYVQLNYEAKAGKTSITHYCITCFNGRFGWVPFVDNFASIASKVKHIDLNKLNEWTKRYMEIDFDNITYSNMFVNCNIPFKFSDAGVSTLCRSIEDLPLNMDPEFTLKVGVCIKDLSIEDLYKLILICGPKTNLQIDFED